MSTSTTEAADLLVPANFLRAVRESGYLNIGTALAELIDNSIEASARKIAISVRRSSPDDLPQITVEDDGLGMSEQDLKTCLRFGGSTRFDSRDSFGRFGMGLPAASLSQARRIEVTAWQENSPASAVSLDVDAVVAGSQTGFHIERAGAEDSRSGCRVQWTHCDRIEYRRLGWLERALHRDLGRMYRRHIASGIVVTLNDQPVELVDPTLLTVEVEGSSAQLPFEPLEYQIQTSSGATSVVTVRFAILPVHAWHHLDNATKRRIGVIGQGGVSILRNGREIASGWHLMGGKRKENYDDWWRCEIEFEPDLDEHFGITINKQGVRPSTALREAMEPELESIARLLSNRVRLAFEEVKFQAASQAACSIATATEKELIPVVTQGTGGPLNYRIDSRALHHGRMFEVGLQGRTLTLALNTEHPAFPSLYTPLQASSERGIANLRTSIELLLLSLARSVAQEGEISTQVENLLAEWSRTYQRMLQRT